MQETQVRLLVQEDLPEKEMAIHSSILSLRIPWTEDPGRLLSMGLQESDMTQQLIHQVPKIKNAFGFGIAVVKSFFLTFDYIIKGSKLNNIHFCQLQRRECVSFFLFFFFNEEHISSWSESNSKSRFFLQNLKL